MSNWVLLKNLADISAGQGAPQGENNYCTNGTPFIKAGNLIELLNGKRETDIQNVSEAVAVSHKLKLYPQGTVLFAKSGMSCMKGYVYELQSDCYVVSHLACITPKTISSSYLKYYFEYHKPNSLVKDEAYPSISLSDIGNLPIKVVNKEKEVEITANLDKIMRLIALKKQQIANFDNLVKSQFIEMFGDPIFNTKGLTAVRLGDISWLKSGKNVTSKDIHEQNVEFPYPCYGGNGIRGFVNKYSHEGAYCLIGRQGALCGNVQIANGKFYPTEHAVVVNQTKNDNVIWLLYCLKFLDLNRLQTGAAQPGLNIEILENVRMPRPELEDQNDFARFVEQTDKSKVLIESVQKLLQILLFFFAPTEMMEKRCQICYNIK